MHHFPAVAGKLPERLICFSDQTWLSEANALSLLSFVSAVGSPSPSIPGALPQTILGPDLVKISISQRDLPT